ncbi:unnamed protein product [Moneuplotes crassus]|uniref:Uncharacterized protein n=1 Tax=Euplotes crassus TaxID=5936 RepID=A0AAD1UP08_EUPCR|nr:unnamed protein product [Moneuplotes crassus]
MSRPRTVQEDDYQAIACVSKRNSFRRDDISTEISSNNPWCHKCKEWSQKCQELQVQQDEMKKYYSSLTEDLQQSVNILLNDYIKDSNAVEKFTQSSEKIKQLRKEGYELKKTLLMMQKNYSDAQQSLEEDKKCIKKAEKELKKTNEGKLMAECNQLKKTVKNLTEEVENLSMTNERLFQDLKNQNFYLKYHELSEKYSKIQKENEKLLDLKIKKFNRIFFKTQSYSGLQGYSSFFNRSQEGRNKLQQILAKNNFNSCFSPSQPRIQCKKIPKKDIDTKVLSSRVEKNSHEKRVFVRKMSFPFKMKCEKPKRSPALTSSKRTKKIMKSLNTTQLTRTNTSEDRCKPRRKYDSISHQELCSEVGIQSQAKMPKPKCQPRRRKKALNPSIPITPRSEYLNIFKRVAI